jgi:putative transposase
MACHACSVNLLAGHQVAKGRVARLMRANGLVGATSIKKWPLARTDLGVSPDRLNRNFRATAPNETWVADITEFTTGEGKIFLAGLPDLFHQGIVGWSTGARQDSVLSYVRNYVFEQVLSATARLDPSTSFTAW